MIRLNFGDRLRVKDMARLLCFVMLAWMTSALMFSSCTLESSDNGDLDGFWHLESVDTLATGKTEDFSQRYVFWGVEHKLIAVKETDTNREKFYFRFEQTGEISLRGLLQVGFALNCLDEFNDLFAQKQYQSLDDVLNEQRLNRKRGKKNE